MKMNAYLRHGDGKPDNNTEISIQVRKSFPEIFIQMYTCWGPDNVVKARLSLGEAMQLRDGLNNQIRALRKELRRRG